MNIVLCDYCVCKLTLILDILHTYFSIAALSIFGEPLLTPVYAPLNISRRAYEHLVRLCNKNIGR